MTFKSLMQTALCSFAIFAALPALANDIEIQSPYAFATATAQKNGAAFFMVVNHGEDADTLVSATGDIANSIELHTHIMDGDMMMMREVEGYDIPAGDTVTLHPMGHHIMLMGLHDKLENGSSFPLTLTFEKAGEQIVDVQIIAPGTKPEDAKPHSEHHGHH